MTCVVVTFRLYLCRYVVWENYAKVSNYYSIRLHAITSFIWNSDDIFHFAFLHRLFSISYTVYGYLFSLISFNKWQQSDNWLLMKWWVGKLIVQFIVWQEKIISLNNDKIFFIWIKGLQRTQKRINKILSCALASVTFLWSDTFRPRICIICRYYIENCIKAKSYTKYI